MTTPFPFGSGNTLLASQLNAITTLPINDQTASYVALVGDVGKRIVMNVASGNTVTINNSVFAAGDTIFIANKGAGATTVTAGAGVTINTASSLILAQHGGGTLVALSASVFTFFSGGALYGLATGGTGSLATPPTGYSGIFFNSSLTLTVSRAGVFDVLAFGGGGGGGLGNGVNAVGGGGGAGQYTQQTIYLAAGSYNVIIGGGGAGSTTANQGTLGSGVTIGNTIGNFAVAGGGGAGSSGPGGVGGSGGGGAGYSAHAGGASFGIATGFAGGAGVATAAAGGGGGAGAVGNPGVATTGGAGGAGFDIATFTGNASTFKSGGGGGGGSSAGGAGGSSVGGAGGTVTGTAAAANTASGGGGSNNGSGAAGGSGVLYIRWKV